MLERFAHRGRLHVVAPAGERGDPADRRADDHGDEPAGQAARQSHVRGPGDQHDRKACQADPRCFPHLERRTHRDEGNRNAGQRTQHRRPRRHCAQLRPDEGAEQDDDADDEAPGESAVPGEHRVLGLQVHRQHDQEHDDEHVRHAGAVRHRGHVAAALGLAELPCEIGVEQVAQRQGDSQRGQDAPEYRIGGQLNDPQAEAGQDDHVEQYVGEQAEEAVPVPGNPQPYRTCVGASVHVLPPCCQPEWTRAVPARAASAIDAPSCLPWHLKTFCHRRRRARRRFRVRIEREIAALRYTRASRRMP